MTDFYTYAETLAAQATRRISPPEANLSQPPNSNPTGYQFITTDAALTGAIAQIADCKVFAIDTETTGLDPHRDRIWLVQLAVKSFPTLVIDLWQVTDWSPLRTLLQGNARKVGHNLKFDWQFLHKAGLPLREPYFDTQLACKVLRAGVPGKSSLAVVVKQLLKVELDKTQQHSDFSHTLSETQIQYAALDAAYTLALVKPLINRLWKKELMRIAMLESACIPATSWLELNGVNLDPTRWQEATGTLQGAKQAALTAFQTALGERPAQQISLLPGLSNQSQTGTNPGSSQQVIQALAKQGVGLKSTEQRSVIRLVHRHPALPHLLEYRRVAKVLGTIEGPPRFVHPQTQRLHPSFFQLGARSGRFSCRNPALQTMPRQSLVRQCFTAAPSSVLIKADYSQIELRIIAKITQDALLVEAYRTGQDVHRLTASLLMGKAIKTVTKEERTIAKSINFGLIYGMSAVRLQLETQLKYGVVLNHEQALAFHKRYFELFEGVNQWHTRTKRSLYRQGQRQARTLLGRVRRWSEPPSFNEFINFPVQGTSADLTKLALVELIPDLNESVRLVLVVHDEIVLEVPEAKAAAIASNLQHCMVMTAAPVLAPIPVVVDVQIGHSWGG